MKLRDYIAELNKLAEDRPETLDMPVYVESTEYRGAGVVEIAHKPGTFLQGDYIYCDVPGPGVLLHE